MWISPKAINFEFKGNNCTATDFLQHRWQIAMRIEKDFPDLSRLTESGIAQIEAILDSEIRPNLPEGVELIFKP